ncbi:MAG TPA: nitrite reductase small subunit NirD [Nitriliruptorales bacterium]|jgi:NAD(P)H-dependent nitrite reductase small subunit
MTPATAMATWTRLCPLEQIIPDSGVCVRMADRQVAVFRLTDDRVFAIDNHDPFSGANVLSRGIVGDADGVLFVASPIHKQRFALSDGRCLDGEDISVTPYRCRVVDGTIEIDLT